MNNVRLEAKILRDRRNVARCAEIVARLSDPNWPGMTDAERADLQHELDALRFERERVQRNLFPGASNA